MRNILLQRAKEMGVKVPDPTAPLNRIRKFLLDAYTKMYLEELGSDYLDKELEREDMSRMVYCTVANHNPDKAALTAERYIIGNDVDVWAADVPLHSGSRGVWLPRAIVDHLRTRKYIRRIDQSIDQNAQDARVFLTDVRNKANDTLADEFSIQELTPPKELKEAIVEELIGTKGVKSDAS